MLCSSVAVWFIVCRGTGIYFCEIALELAVSCKENATVNFQNKSSIEFQIDQAHSAKLASLLNVIDQFMLHSDNHPEVYHTVKLICVLLSLR